MFFSSAILSAALLSALAHAADHAVKVGSGGNKFSPDSIQAQVGDTVTFQWTGTDHDVIQASFDKPCSPLSGGFQVPPQSGSSATFTVEVTSTDPMWFYCSVSAHCQIGMVGVINPPSGETVDQFAQAASNAGIDGSTPNSVVGGTLVVGGSTSAGATSAPTGSSSGGSSSASAGGASTTGTSSGSAAMTTTSSMGGVAAMATAAPAALALFAGAVAAYL